MDDNCHGSGGAAILQWIYISSHTCLVLGAVLAGFFTNKTYHVDEDNNRNSSVKKADSNGNSTHQLSTEIVAEPEAVPAEATEDGEEGEKSNILSQPSRSQSHESIKIQQRSIPIQLLIPMILFVILFVFQIAISSGAGGEALQNRAGAVTLVLSAGVARFCDGTIYNPALYVNEKQNIYMCAQSHTIVVTSLICTVFDSPFSHDLHD